MEQHHQLPGSFYSKKDDSAAAATSNLPLAIISSVLFPHAESFLLCGGDTTLSGGGGRGDDGSTNLPGAWTQENSSILDEQQDDPPNTESIAELRRTVEQLRKRAEQLEYADKMVKKGIQVVAQKRVLVQQKSTWDWCDTSGGSDQEQQDHQLQDQVGPVTDETTDGWVWVESHRVAAWIIHPVYIACTYLYIYTYQHECKVHNNDLFVVCSAFEKRNTSSLCRGVIVVVVVGGGWIT